MLRLWPSPEPPRFTQKESTLLRSGIRADTSSPMGNCKDAPCLRSLTCLLSCGCDSMFTLVNFEALEYDCRVSICRHGKFCRFCGDAALSGASKWLTAFCFAR